MSEAIPAVAAGLLMGVGPVTWVAGRWTAIDRWWRWWCGLTCGSWAGCLAMMVAGTGRGAEAPITATMAFAWASTEVFAWASTVVFASAATLLSVIDLRERRLPHLLTAAAGCAAIGFGFATGEARAALWGAAIAYGVHVGIRIPAPRAIGGGDAQLAISVGAIAGPAGAVAMASAFVVAAVVTTSLIGVARRASAPHGPSLCVAAMVASAWYR